MRRFFVFCLLFACVFPAAAWAKFSLKPAPQLWVYAARIDVQSAEKLVKTHALDAETLGRALLNSLRRADKASSDSQMAITRLLLTYGADANYTALNGQTPLMMAAAAQDERLVRLLLENGARPDAKDIRGLTPKDYAQSRPGLSEPVLSLLRRPPPLAPLRVEAPMPKPEIQNLNMSDDDNLITFTYDLSASAPVCVRLIGSLDGGATYAMKFISVSGDVGMRVPPGKNKRLTWDSARDYPSGFGDANVIVDLLAEPCP